MNLGQRLTELIAEGAGLYASLAVELGGFESWLQPRYVGWRLEAISVLISLGEPVKNILRELEEDPHALRVNSESANRILGALRGALVIVEREGLTTSSSTELGVIAENIKEAKVPTPSDKNETTEYDVFLCHNSKDKPAVKKIGQQLRVRGIRPWLDEWETRPGEIWQRALEKQIGNIKAVAVFIGPDGMGPWEDLERLASIQQFVDRHCPVIPVILSGCQSDPQLPPFLQLFHRVDFRKADPDPIEQVIWGITRERGKSSSFKSQSQGESVDTPPKARKRHEQLAQGADTFEIKFVFSIREMIAFEVSDTEHDSQFIATWEQIFGTIAPLLMNEKSVDDIRWALDNFVEKMNRSKLDQMSQFRGETLVGFRIADSSFYPILLHLRRLGWIQKSDKARHPRDISTYWVLTPDGDGEMTRILAVRKNDSSDEPVGGATKNQSTK